MSALKAGQLLVATDRNAVNPDYKESTILVLRDDGNGTIGINLSRASTVSDFETVTKATRPPFATKTALPKKVLLEGGKKNTGIPFATVSPFEGKPEIKEQDVTLTAVFEGSSVASEEGLSNEVVKSIDGTNLYYVMIPDHGEEAAQTLKALAPQNIILAYGYTEWEPEKLSQQIESGLWAVAPHDLDVIFSIPHDETWKQTAVRHNIDTRTPWGSSSLKSPKPTPPNLTPMGS